jgi:hypothetical protein
VTSRDRIVVIVVLAAVALGGFWFGLLSPKRAEVAKLHTDVAAQQQRLDQARASMATAQAAKQRYASDYAAVANLGKAVPVDDNVPSLVYQLGTAADGAHIDFQSIKLTGSGTAQSVPSKAAAAVAGASAAPNDGGPTPTPAASAPATQTAAATLPPGATVGPAGLPTMPFTFVFQGSFFSMEKFLRNVEQFIDVKGDNVLARGRLLTIDGVALTASDKGFPNVKASLTATAYLLPPGEGLTNGATPKGPAAAQPVSAPGGSSSTTAPTATATGVTP